MTTDENKSCLSISEAAQLAETLDRKSFVFQCKAKADHTRRAYALDWKLWCDFCGALELNIWEPSVQDVCRFLTWLAVERDLAAVSVQRILAGVRQKLDARLGKKNVTRDERVLAVLDGIRREKGIAPKNRKTAIQLSQLRQMVMALNRGSHEGKRDAALLLLAWCTGMRRAELVQLDRSDVMFVRGGFEVRCAKSKTDPLRLGRVFAVHPARLRTLCPVRAMREWMAVETGCNALFVGLRDNRFLGRLDVQMVAKIVKRCVKSIGLEAYDFAAHSLRSGFVSHSLSHGTPETVVMSRTGHKTHRMMQTYYRDVTAWQIDYTRVAGL